MKCHVPIQSSAFVKVGVEYSAVNDMSCGVLQNGPELSLDIWISKSDCTVHVVGCVVRYYLIKEYKSSSLRKVRHLNFAAHGSGQLHPVKKTPLRLYTGVVVGEAVGGGFGAHVDTIGTVRCSTGSVAYTLDTAPHQRELVGVHDGVNGLERDIGHLHCPLTVTSLRPEPVAQCLTQPDVPTHSGHIR